MLLTLTQISGPGAGRRAQLRSGQRLVVGRTEWSDFVVADPALADRHLEIACGVDGASFRALAADPPTQLNGEPAEAASVYHEDRLALAGSVFQVVLDPPAAKPRAENGADEAAPQVPRAADFVDAADLEEEALALLNDADAPLDFLAALVDAGDWESSFRFAAAVLGPRPAVDWAVQCIQGASIAAKPREQAVLQRAAAWIAGGDDADRRGAQTAAEAFRFQGTFGMLGMATFWAGDNIAAADAEHPFPPPPALPPRGIGSTLLLAAVHGDVAQASARRAKFIELAQGLIAAAAAEAAAPV